VSPELAVGLALAAFVLMVGIVAGFTALVLLDAVVAWPARPKQRATLGAQYWVRSKQTETAAMPVAGWSR
jgi:hypothetical protein